MKKWTVMLVPQGQGVTRTLHLYSFQLWLFIVILLGLAFTSAFFFQWFQAAQTHARILEKSNHELARARSEAPATTTGLTDEERAEIERRVRAEYEEQNAVVARELSELRDLEDSIRRVQKLPPKIKHPYGVMMNMTPGKENNGKGGPLDGGGPLPAQTASDDMMGPPQLIYGLSRPPADLIIQEINLRTESLRELLTAMDAKRDRIERTPLGWPVLSRQRQISSGFGLRFDPFTHRLSRHEGLDIRAPYGTKIYAVARGVVVTSAYDGDYGNVVVIRHGDGFETLYGHMSERLAKPGQAVGRGDVIGLVGSTGRSTGNHCHYEVRLSGVAVDPENYLGN